MSTVRPLVLVSLIVSAACLADEEGSYSIPVTRAGTTVMRVAVNRWSGEYPQPVIDVSSGVEGKTTVEGYRSLRVLEETRACTIQNGLYHPWSRSKGSLKAFYSLIASVGFRAKRATRVGDQALKAGARIIRVAYLAEGYCSGVLAEGERGIDFRCSELADNPDVEKVGVDDRFEEQWLYLHCAEGYDSFVRDEDLLEAPGVRMGRIVRYGAVAGAGS